MMDVSSGGLFKVMGIVYSIAFPHIHVHSREIA